MWNQKEMKKKDEGNDNNAMDIGKNMQVEIYDK